MPSGIRPIAAPWSARPEIISVTDGATAQSTEPTTSRVAQISMILRLP